MAKLIDNESGNVSKGLQLEGVADSYKLSFNCTSIGDGKSFIRIYATLNDTSCKTYFFPIQFLNENEIEFSLDGSTTAIQFDMIGNAMVTGITLEEVTNATMEYVKANSTYWDRIKEVTSSTGKVRAEMMEGIINMAVNAFANDSGTVKQENGVYTFLNGTTVEDSTQAVRICGGAIEIANSKDEKGEWDWSTAITGEGINAKAIVANSFAAINIAGAKITGGTIVGGNITGVNINGSTLISGTVESGTYILMDQYGNIEGYKYGKKVLAITVQGTTYPQIRLSTNCDDLDAEEFRISEIYNYDTGKTEFSLAVNNTSIHMHSKNVSIQAYDELYIQGGDRLILNGGYEGIKCMTAIYDQQGRLITGE